MMQHVKIEMIKLRFYITSVYNLISLFYWVIVLPFLKVFVTLQLIFFFPGGSVRVSNEPELGHPRAAKYSVYVTVFQSLLIGIFFMVAILITKDYFAVIFTSSTELQEAVSRLAIFLGVTMVLNSVQPVISGIILVWHYDTPIFIAGISSILRNWICMLQMFKFKGSCYLSNQIQFECMLYTQLTLQKMGKDYLFPISVSRFTFFCNHINMLRANFPFL